MKRSSICPECAGCTVLRHRFVDVASVVGARLMPVGGGPWAEATFEVLVCADCGLTRMFAEPRTLTRFRESAEWRKVP